MKLAGVIGSPIGHSKSSMIFNSIFTRQRIDAFYMSVDVKPGELEAFAKASAETFAGYNVTAPHKVSIIKYMDSIEPEAAEIGAVNLVRIVNGKSVGYNVDLAGFAAAVNNSQVDFHGKNILIAGYGGIFRTVSYYIFRNFHPNSVDVMVRDPVKAGEKLMDYVFRDKVALVSSREADRKSHDILINCTPLGTYPDISGMPFSDKLLNSASVGIDVVYNPPVTGFLNRMARKGATIVTGEDLFIYQAIESMKILFGVTVMKDEILEILRGGAQ